MIRVTIEVLPKGDENRKRHVGTIEIANDGTGDSTIGNYIIRLAKFGSPRQTWLHGKLTGFNRVKRGPYDLLLQCLLATIGPRNSQALKKYKLDQTTSTNLQAEEV